MKKLLLLCLVLLGGVMQMSANNTSVTVYCAIPTSETGYNSVKLNVNHRGWGDSSGDWWQEYDMTKTDKTYFGKYIYSCTYTSPYDGEGVIQFQLYNNGEWQRQVVAFACTESNKFLSQTAFNGKMWEYDNTDGKWRSYNYDKTVTIHCKKNNDWIPSNCYNYFNDGATGDVYEQSFPGKTTTQSTINGDWYDYTITGRPCTTAIMNKGTGGTGNQSGNITIGDDKEYWVTYDGTTTTQATTVPANFSYSRNVTSGNFGTICLPYAATVEGAKVFKIVSTVGTGDDMTGINLEDVSSLEAGKAYIFKATASTLTATLSGNYTEASEANGMMGNLSSSKIDVPTDKYIIYQNKIRKVGTGVTCGQYKGYITLEGLNVTNARSANFINFEDTTTGIANVDINDNFDANAPMYNLAGQRVGKNYKGVVIVNGKKMLNK